MPSNAERIVFTAALSDPDLRIRKGDVVTVDRVTFEVHLIRPLPVQPGRLLGAIEAGTVTPLSTQPDDALDLLRSALEERRSPRRPVRVLPFPLPPSPSGPSQAAPLALESGRRGS